MRVASKVVYDLFRSPEGTLGIDHPLDVAQLFQETVEELRFGKLYNLAVKFKLVVLVGGPETAHEKAPVEPRQDLNGQEEVLA
jgi:hypothetical protein